MCPIYTFESLDTGEFQEVTMSISEMEEFEKNNPSLRRSYQPIRIVDPIGIGVSKPPADFLKGVVGRIKETAVGANKTALEKRFHIPREW